MCNPSLSRLSAYQFIHFAICSASAVAVAVAGEGGAAQRSLIYYSNP
jgi:hypothetical protein